MRSSPALAAPASRLRAHTFGVTPDMMTCAKGLTNGAVPMGAVICKREIHDAFMQGPDNAIEFPHGYTYSAHPLACAAGLATLETYHEEGLLTRASTVGQTSARRCTVCARCPT